MFRKLLAFASAHKVISGLIILGLAAGGYYGYKAAKGGAAPTRYIMATVQKGTVVTTIDGTGQTSVTNQLDVKPKVSADVIKVLVDDGQEVKAGQLMVQLDTTDAQKAVRDARANLESAKISLAKLVEPADALSILQAENALDNAKVDRQTAADNLAKTYDDGFSSVSNAFLDMPAVMKGIHDILYSATLTNDRDNIDYYYNAIGKYNPSAAALDRASADNDYQAAYDAYQTNTNDFKSVTRNSDRSTIESIVNETYQTSTLVAQALKSANNLIRLYEDTYVTQGLKPSTIADGHLSNINTYTGQINSHVSDLSNAGRTIQGDKDALTQAAQAIDERTASLAKLKAGPDALDVQSAQLSVTQRQNALTDAQNNLADYYIRAPFDGIAAKVNVQVGDPAGSGTSVVTMITTRGIAEISMNEIDAAKVKVGQKVTLTFDAVPDLSIAGEVDEIDTIGTVSQGVVTYTVRIGFDTQDPRVKPGMSAGASIITEVRQDVLTVPNSAIKAQGNVNYVEVFDQTPPAEPGGQGVVSAVPPRPQPVEIGLASDTTTEIVSGLKEGDQVVVRTVTGSTSTSGSSSAGGTNRTNGGAAGAGNVFRFVGGGGRPPGD